MRVPRTFVFLDLGGFTNYTASLGDDAAGAILSSFRAIAREVASERGVRIAKWLGDGCMLVAVDQSDGIAAVLDMQQRCRRVVRPLNLRAGIASGYALLFEGDDYIGSAVNLAARLCDVAGPWEVLTPVDVADDLPEGAVALPHGALDLRGFPDPIEVMELSGEVGRRNRNDTGELWTRSPFVA